MRGMSSRMAQDTRLDQAWHGGEQGSESEVVRRALGAREVRDLFHQKRRFFGASHRIDCCASRARMVCD